MGERVVATEFTGADRTRFRERLRAGFEVFRRMLAEDRFERGRTLMGVELELDLVGPTGRPVMVNQDVLSRIASRDFQTELGQFNLEVNIAPHKLVGTVFSELAEELRTSLAYADRQARAAGARILMIGILPTLDEAHMIVENFSDEDRYFLLNDEIVQVRGEDFLVQIDGVERLRTTFASIMPEACNTSVQFHLQVSPETFAGAWNAAQAIAGVQVALGANSPFLFGRELWAETRIPLFEQATDFRVEELAAQGVRPRVWFGERWISSPLDLFEENLRYFTALLPVCSDEDPEKVLAEGGIPHLPELRLHNGTVYRWNRPVYDVARGKPHLRVENRVLPAGPTVVDVLANAAFFYGCVKAMMDDPDPVWGHLAFADAARNLHDAARFGLAAELEWRRDRYSGPVSVPELVLSELLPTARRGLDALGIDRHDRDEFLGIIEGRCRTGRNGATWLSGEFHRLVDDEGLDRASALERLTIEYSDLMLGGAPAHTWALG
ncbi:glutamate--cysteine ligase [Catenulispora sp. NF23]|uniref:Glutamate--cysteine ligase n=1 Tax=Catenulispora pinistramenti TaxID=2705254 RepID=A0ABS5KU64_9ACTN|nr:glutamate--cysteine ligase [Catenulispora pinistramenti]MBS2539634.1 glutamate--cysteine ligase [Catenulispora pinistramenti]MBS2549591.1 glutamate--cysteine ligase [Catenulispora pinistramenti]